MIEGTGVEKHTPEWLEEIARRLYETDLQGGDGIAYALEWAAHDIRLLEKHAASVSDGAMYQITNLKLEISRLESEMLRMQAAEIAEEMIEVKGAWS